jgi:hypothetical protein
MSSGHQTADMKQKSQSDVAIDGPEILSINGLPTTTTPSPPLLTCSELSATDFFALLVGDSYFIRFSASIRH